MSMAEERVIDIMLRPKRQMTLPKEICEQLGIGPGDMLELSLEGSTLRARPKKVGALEALGEIREAFKRSGVAEEELLTTGRRIRHEIVRERYAAKG